MTRIADIDWLDCEPGATEATIADLEAELGIRFPDDFRRFAAECEGGRPADRTRVRYVGPRGREFIASLGGLLKLARRADDGIARAIEHLAVDDQLPPGLIPFGEVGDGDLFCFQYRNGETTVVLWLHGVDEDAAIVPIAGSFTEFLHRLEPR